MTDGGDEELARLRERPENTHLLRGFGPLAVGVVLFVMMVLLAPTIAPERVVERPVGGTTTTSEPASTTSTSATSTSAPATTTTVAP